MHLVNKLIFNSLSARSGINLPGVGCLFVERVPARLKSREKLVPPYYIVKFHTWEEPHLDSAVELISRGNGDVVLSLGIYNAWLGDMGIRPSQGKAAMPSPFEIEGVGVLKGSVFTPSPELEKVLNPGNGNLVKLKPRLRNYHIYLIVAGCVALAVAAVMSLNLTPEARQQAEMRRQMRYMEKRNSELASRGREILPPPGTERKVTRKSVMDSIASLSDSTAIAIALQKIAKQAADSAAAARVAQASQPAADNAAVKPTSVVESSQPAALSDGTRFHLVLGVYSTQENAQKSITQLSSKDNSLSYTVVPMGEKFIVSGFSSSDRDQAENKRRELSGSYPGVWIYKYSGAR